MQRWTDEQLILELKNDRERAFAALYDRYASVLLRYAVRFCAGQAQAEDLLHDVFTELLKTPLPDFGSGGLKPWLFTVTKNKCLNALRKNQREISVATAPEQISARTPEDEMSDAQFSAQLKLCETTLPRDLRDTWNLRKQGFDYQQIASQLSIPIGTVKSRFHRLTQLLRKELGHELE